MDRNGKQVKKALQKRRMAGFKNGRGAFPLAAKRSQRGNVVKTAAKLGITRGPSPELALEAAHHFSGIGPD